MEMSCSRSWKILRFSLGDLSGSPPKKSMSILGGSLYLEPMKTVEVRARQLLARLGREKLWQVGSESPFRG